MAGEEEKNEETNSASIHAAVSDGGWDTVLYAGTKLALKDWGWTHTKNVD